MSALIGKMIDTFVQDTNFYSFYAHNPYYQPMECLPLLGKLNFNACTMSFSCVRKG